MPCTAVACGYHHYFSPNFQREQAVSHVMFYLDDKNGNLEGLFNSTTVKN